MSRIEEQVIRKIRERSVKGEAEHGSTMERDDLTLKEWLIHLQDELMDGSIYVEKLLELLDEVVELLTPDEAMLECIKRRRGDES